MGDLTEGQFEGRIPPRDRELSERICAGDADAIRELLVNRCGRVIAQLVRRFCYPDLFGDLYVALQKDGWRKLAVWRGECCLEHWIWKIAFGLSIERARRDKRIVFLEPEKLINHTGGVTPDFDSPLRRRDLLRAIASLKDPRQRTIMLGTLQNRPIEEMAGTLRITRGNADVLKKRAIDHIKEFLEERGRGQNA
jgi:RNA polymerase sigma factor (sigma-70 family)